MELFEMEQIERFEMESKHENPTLKVVILWNGTVWNGTVWKGMVLNELVWNGMIWNGMVRNRNEVECFEMEPIDLQ